MLSELEVGQFHAFGFTVIRNCLSADEFEQIEKAYKRIIPSAPLYEYFTKIGTRMTSRFLFEDECLGNLIEHPKVMEVMRDIWGTECLYNGGQDMWENRDETPWHCDGPPGRKTVTLKIALYFDEMDENSGSLNVIPGSHHPEFSERLFQTCGYWEKGSLARACGSIGIISRELFLSIQNREILFCGITTSGTRLLNEKMVAREGHCLSATHPIQEMICSIFWS